MPTESLGGAGCNSAETKISNSEAISVAYENYNQAETARNFANWAKLGGENKLLHLTELSPIGPDAPTIRMNLDTLYSVGVFDNTVGGGLTVTVQESGLYQSVMILDTDGYTPFFFTEPGVYHVKHASRTLFIGVRTMVKDRHDKASFALAHVAQKGVTVSGGGSTPYVAPAFNQEQLKALTAEYNNTALAGGIKITYGDGVTPVNETHRTLSNAVGWGGMVCEVGVSNSYTTSRQLSGQKKYAVTFPDPKNKFFTSFTLYDANGYLLGGNSHVNSYTWKPNHDKSITVHFNCEGEINNITSSGKDFNYVVRNYGASQAVIDGAIDPTTPSLVE